MVEAAICGVAIATSEPRRGSTAAIAVGVATALPAVVAAAMPATPVPPASREASTLHTAPAASVMSPSRMPDRPAPRIACRLICAPRPKAKKGISRSPPDLRKRRMSSSRLPSTMPITIGSTVATRSITGMVASPDKPSATIVTNGPSRIESTASAPRSTSSPNWRVTAAYRPMLALVTAAMIAMPDRPNRP